MGASAVDIPGFLARVAKIGRGLGSGSRRFARRWLVRLIIPLVCAMLTSCSIPQAVPVCHDLRERISNCTPPLHLVLGIPQLVFRVPCEAVFANPPGDADYWGSTISYKDGGKEYTLLVLQGVYWCKL